MSDYNQEIIFGVFFVTIVFVLLVGFTISYISIFNKKKKQHKTQIENHKKEFQQQLTQSQIEVQELTYSSLSKELHDNVGQLLSTAKMLMGLTARKLENPPDTLHTADATIGKAIQELRSLSKALDKDWLEQFSFSDNLQTEIERINSSKNVKAEINISDNLSFEADSQIILFRIVQEAMQNAIKHASPDHISVNVLQDEERLSIFIIDNGKGFNFSSPDGMGIKNMKQRTHLLGGTILWDSKPGNGTTVNILFPKTKTIA